MQSTTDTEELIAGFASMESMVFDQHDFAWSSRFLQPERNFLNNQVSLLWSTMPLPFPQQMFGLFR